MGTSITANSPDLGGCFVLYYLCFQPNKLSRCFLPDHAPHAIAGNHHEPSRVRHATQCAATSLQSARMFFFPDLAGFALLPARTLLSNQVTCRSRLAHSYLLSKSIRSGPQEYKYALDLRIHTTRMREPPFKLSHLPLQMHIHARQARGAHYGDGSTVRAYNNRNLLNSNKNSSVKYRNTYSKNDKCLCYI
jgi:hypothetical protein